MKIIKSFEKVVGQKPRSLDCDEPTFSNIPIDLRSLGTGNFVPCCCTNDSETHTSKQRCYSCKSVVNGEVNAPGSKSMMIRAVAASFLSNGESKIINPSYAEDCEACLGIIETLGAEVIREENLVKVNGGVKEIKGNKINCKESGLCMRMFAPIVSLYSQEIILEAEGSLLQRPVNMVEETLGNLGIKCKSNNDFPPLTVKGPIKGGKIKIDGSKTSQLITGLLMALPKCSKDSEIEIENLKSKPYVKMTLSLLEKYGISIEHDAELTKLKIKGNQEYKNAEYKVEGDWSGASFLLVAGAIAGKVKVNNLQLNSEQADRKIIEVLERVGAKIIMENDFVEIERKELNGFEFDATDCPDLFPPLVALAANCNGISKIKGVERLRIKESDRASALEQEFNKLGIKIEIKCDKMIITGGEIKGGIVNSHKDHRIAMACAVAGINSIDEVKIENPYCVSKSYPNFYTDLKKLGVKI